jgi:hypothetical protein
MTGRGPAIDADASFVVVFPDKSWAYPAAVE